MVIADPDKIILFGSQVKGNADNESDYDLLVLKKNLNDQRKTTQEIYFNFRNIGAPVDVIVIDSEKFEEVKENPYLIYKEIFLTGQIVYER